MLIKSSLVLKEFNTSRPTLYFYGRLAIQKVIKPCKNIAAGHARLTKLVVHKVVVSSTFTTTLFSYTRIPNGVIKVIIM